MNRKALALAVTLLLLTVLAIAACSSAEPTKPAPTKPAPTISAPTAAPAPDGAALLQERCARHHSLDRVAQAKKTLSEWEATVTRMIAKGASLNDAEAKILAQHLTQMYGK